jgi:hypothetical protein
VHPLLLWKSNKYYLFWVCVCVCVCSLSYPTCIAHAPYCHLWPLRLYNIFPHYLINGMLFGEKTVLTQNVFLIISATCVWNIFYSKKDRARYDQKCKLVFMQSPRYTCNILMMLQFSRQIFGKYSNIRCSIRMDGQRDEHKLVVALRNFANGSKNELCYRESFTFACSNSSNQPFWLENSRAFLCVFTVAD